MNMTSYIRGSERMGWSTGPKIVRECGASIFVASSIILTAPPFGMNRGRESRREFHTGWFGPQGVGHHHISPNHVRDRPIVLDPTVAIPTAIPATNVTDSPTSACSEEYDGTNSSPFSPSFVPSLPTTNMPSSFKDIPFERLLPPKANSGPPEKNDPCAAESLRRTRFFPLPPSPAPFLAASSLLLAASASIHRTAASASGSKCTTSQGGVLNSCSSYARWRMDRNGS
mmetsp:Transcript_19695/g.39930  ORF Transcript_19695/g.39930 Transcript_19695/m.39930 type:complete len:228 (-) Transcript_19695:557-1240(-)